MPENFGSEVTGMTTASIGDAMRELRRRPSDSWLDLIRADQSDRWRQGQGVQAEEYFSQCPQLREDDEEAQILICGEIHLRRECGQRPSVDEYQLRFPALANEIALQFEVDRMLEQSPEVSADVESVDSEAAWSPELPGYEFLERIGSGASGVVLRARQASLDRSVAIEVLSMPGADPKRLARQRQEAEILGRLKHPNVVHVYEVIDRGGCLYLVMEYVEGPTLSEFAAGKVLAPDVSARLVFALAATMQAVHEAGVVHRDLKPSNVLMAGAEQVRISDFGLAKLRTGDNLLTTEDSVLGTPSYMSPEQAIGSAQAAGPGTDVYSLGAILYDLLTGRPPFLGATVLDTLSLIRDQDPVPPRYLQPGTPADLETICLHCLNKAPQNRYPTAAALASDLRRFLDGEPILARRFTSAERLARWCRRKPAVAALAGTVALLLVAAVAILTASNARIRREAAAKDAALATARQAVDQMLMKVANEKLSHMPLGHPLRAELLQDALQFYEGFFTQANRDASLREEMAAVLNSMGCIQRELGRCDDACRSFERSIALLASIVAADPRPPAIREKLVAAQEGLAYTWQINRADAGGAEADKHYRWTLQMYQALERDWPERRQPVVLCLRRLADIAFAKGDRAEATKFWRDSIAKGENYLQQQPANLDARSNLCWACADVADSLLQDSNANVTQVELVLNQGLRHAAVMRQQDPRSTQVRQVDAFMQFCLARCYCRTGRGDEALVLFDEAIAEMESLCAEFPWNTPYWELVRYFAKETVLDLRSANRPDDARRLLRQMAAWLNQVAPQIPDEKAPQRELRRCRAQLDQLRPL